MIRITVLQVKVIHAFCLAFLLGCIGFTIWSAATNQVTAWTWFTMASVVVEGIFLMAFKWRCPLTVLAENLGAEHPSVADIFFPKWFADRLFPICGTAFIVACAVIAYRFVQAQA